MQTDQYASIFVRFDGNAEKLLLDMFDLAITNTHMQANAERGTKEGKELNKRLRALKRARSTVKLIPVDVVRAQYDKGVRDGIDAAMKPGASHNGW
jgi:hypothetical protein